MKQPYYARTGLIIAAMVWVASGAAMAQSKARDSKGDRPAAPRSEASKPTESGGTEGGFWPTPKMMDGFMKRGADDIARRYSLSDEQREALLADMRGRWPK